MKILFCLNIFQFMQTIVQSAIEVRFQIVEECPINSVVGNIHQQVVKNGGTKSDDCIYKPTSNIHPFNIDYQTYDLRVMARIDRETLCKGNVKNNHIIGQNCEFGFMISQTRSYRENQKLAEDVSPQIIKVLIEILDINDNPPRWSNSRVYFELPEHSKRDTKIALPLALDPDQPPVNTTKTYSIIHQSVKNGFTLRHSNDGKIESLWLLVNQDFDRETLQPNILVKIQATDGGSPSLSGQLEINITLIDINDKVPKFASPTQIKVIKENIPLRTKILKLVAYDEDESDKHGLRYQFDNSADESVKNHFSINSITGEILTNGYIDYEAQAEYTIPVTVSDGKHLDRMVVTVEVENINDNPPEINVFYISGSSFKMPRHNTQYRVVVSENRDPGFVLASFSVADNDSATKNGNSNVPKLGIDCKIETNGDCLELRRLSASINDHFQIVTTKKFDREEASQYYAQLTCFDGGQSSLTTSVTFEISVSDINDNAPTFKVPDASLRTTPTYSIKEGSAVGTTIIQVKAVDYDIGENANIHYSLDATSTKYFSIDPLTGELRSAEVFDYELIDRYELTINASNPLSERNSVLLFSLQKIAVNIEDVNDCPPEFSKDLYNFEVKEGQSKDVLVGRVDVKDNDRSPLFNTNYFKILNNVHDYYQSHEPNPYEYFRIGETGFIYVQVPVLDREKVSSFSFKVLAVDKSDRPLSSTAIVQIRIIDVNDNPPQWIFPNAHSYTVNVSYHEPVGHCIASLKTSDPDLGDNGKVVYRIVPSLTYHSPINQDAKLDKEDKFVTSQSVQILKKHELFELESATGNIYVAQKMSVKDVGLKALWIEARDLGNPPLKTYERLLVYIINNNNNRVNIYPTPNGRTNKSGFESDLMIMIVLIAIIILVAMVMVIIILMLRCRNSNRLLTAKFCRDACQSTNRSLLERRPDGHSSSQINDICHTYSGPKRSQTVSTYLGQSAGSSQLFDLTNGYLTDPNSRTQLDADCCDSMCHSMTRIPVTRVNNSTFAKKYYTSSVLYRPNTLWTNEASPELSKRFCQTLNNNLDNSKNFSASPIHSEPPSDPNDRDVNIDFAQGGTTKKSVTLPNFLSAIEECDDNNVNSAIKDDPPSTFKQSNSDKMQNRLSVTWLDKFSDNNTALSQNKKKAIQYKSVDSCLNTPNLETQGSKEHEYTQLQVLPNDHLPGKPSQCDYPVTYV